MRISFIVIAYCDRGPVHVEASSYDSVYTAVAQELARDGEPFRQVLEVRLKPCTCGGTFRHDVVRRRLVSHVPVIVEDPSRIDLSFWTDEFMEAEEQRHAPYTRTDDLWKDDEVEGRAGPPR
jgi:hypothetical protein